MNNISSDVVRRARHYFGLRITDDVGGEEGSEKSGQKGSAHRLGHRGRRAQSVRTGRGRWRGREKGKDEEARWRKLEQQQRLRLSVGMTHEMKNQPNQSVGTTYCRELLSTFSTILNDKDTGSEIFLVFPTFLKLSLELFLFFNKIKMIRTTINWSQIFPHI